MISHIDITPTMLDFAGGLDHNTNGPKQLLNYKKYWADKGRKMDNLDGGHKWNAYHGKSWLHTLDEQDATHWETIFASHTFHEIQMYYPMRVVRDSNYKLIWNIAHQLPYPLLPISGPLQAGKLNSRREKRLCMDKRRSINTSSEIDLNSLILRTIPMNHVTSPMIQNLQSNSKSTRLCSSNTRN